MNGFFKFFDIYGSNFNLRINGQSKFRSVIGGLLSIITIGILIWTIRAFGLNFFLRENAKITLEDGLYTSAELPILNGTDYKEKHIVIQYERDFDKKIKPYYMKLNANNTNFVFLQPCDINYLINNSIIEGSDDFYYNYYTFYCLKLNDVLIGGLTGSRSSKASNPLSIGLIACSEIGEEVIIQSNLTSCDTTFNETLNVMTLTLWYDKIGFNPNLESPFISKLTSATYVLTNDKMSLLYFPISIYNLVDDIGWITSTYEYSSDFNFLQSSSNLYPDSNNFSYPNTYINIYVSDDYKTFTRTYMKLQDLMATIGGFMKLVFTLLNGVNMIIRIYLIDYYLVNKIFDNEASTNFNVSNNISKTVFASPRPKSATSKNPIEEVNSSKKNARPHLINLLSYFKAVIYNFFNRKFDMKTKKGKQLEEIRKKILVSDNVRDFNYILGKMTEVDLLKSILLNDQQALSMEYIQKPKEVDLIDAPHRFSKLVNSDEVNKNIIKEYFSKLVSQDSLMGHDEFLFNRLNEDIKEVILSNLANSMIKS